MTDEAPLEPERPIIDPHLHLWEIFAGQVGHNLAQRFFVPEVAEMIAASRQNITHSVFVQCGAMHRASGPEELRPVGETEFVRGQAAMSDSGHYGRTRLCHRIVGTANLLLGDRVSPVLEAHVEAGGGRFCGIRMAAAWRESGMFSLPGNPAMARIIARPEYRAGARVLAEMGLSLDVWLLHSQLEDLITLADELPDLAIVLDHVGTPDLAGPYAGRKSEAMAEWAARIAALAERPNVSVKLGGCGMDVDAAMGAVRRNLPSEVLAAQWRPLIETCIEAFTPARAMFESNFPPDNSSGSYGATWNAFKRLVAGYSEDEKDALFRRTAARTYRIDLEA